MEKKNLFYQMYRRLLFIIICCFISCLADAQTSYKVTVSSRLNIRQTPSTKGRIIGFFKNDEVIQVISINNGWAKVRCNKGIGYVSESYIKMVPPANRTKPSKVNSPVKELPVTPNPSTSSSKDKYSSKGHNRRTLASEIKGIDYPLLEFGANSRSDYEMYLAIQGNCGFSNFRCSEVSSNGTLAYGGEVQLQFYKSQGILTGYYAQAGIGYQSLGAAGYDMGYIQARILPLGYVISSNDDLNVVVKAGGYVGMPLSDLKTKNDIYSASLDYGIDCGVCIDYKMFSIGATFQYGFSEVAPSSRATLNNMGIFGTISYKFAKF